MAALRRLLLCSLCLTLLVTGGLAEGFRFTLNADIEPQHCPAALQQLAAAADALLDAMTLSGSYVSAPDGSFDLHSSICMQDGSASASAAVQVYGVPSHWGVRSPLLGDTELMINLLALLEFGIKADQHLDIPLQYPALLVPYVHTSALEKPLAILSPLFPAENGEYTISVLQVWQMAAELSTLLEEDRTLRCWITAMALDSGLDQQLYDLAPMLPAASAVMCLRGVRVTRTDTSLTWHTGSTQLLRIAEANGTITVDVTWSDLLDAHAVIRVYDACFTGSMHIDSPVVNASARFSMPASWPVTVPFFLDAQAEGPLTSSRKVECSITGEARGDTLTLRCLGAEQQAILTLTAVIEPFTPDELPAFRPEDLTGVNLLSVDGDSLKELMQDVRGPLLRGMLQLVAATPARACQSLMDLLEDSGVMDLLAEAMTGGDFTY